MLASAETESGTRAKKATRKTEALVSVRAILAFRIVPHIKWFIAVLRNGYASSVAQVLLLDCA